jgi:hypothetical protein
MLRAEARVYLEVALKGEWPAAAPRPLLESLASPERLVARIELDVLDAAAKLHAALLDVEEHRHRAPLSLCLTAGATRARGVRGVSRHSERAARMAGALPSELWLGVLSWLDAADVCVFVRGAASAACARVCARPRRSRNAPPRRADSPAQCSMCARVCGVAAAGD